MGRLRCVLLGHLYGTSNQVGGLREAACLRCHATVTYLVMDDYPLNPVPPAVRQI
jgi:hypothetical protein